jgi:hypothetical protein
VVGPLFTRKIESPKSRSWYLSALTNVCFAGIRKYLHPLLEIVCFPWIVVPQTATEEVWSVLVGFLPLVQSKRWPLYFCPKEVHSDMLLIRDKEFFINYEQSTLHRKLRLCEAYTHTRQSIGHCSELFARHDVKSSLRRVLDALWMSKARI